MNPDTQIDDGAFQSFLTRLKSKGATAAGAVEIAHSIRTAQHRDGGATAPKHTQDQRNARPAE